MAHSRMFWVSIWAHVGVIVLLMGYSFLQGCPLKKKTKPAEVVTWVQMQSEPAPVIEKIKTPEPIKPEPVKPEPIKPKPVVPEPVAPKPLVPEKVVVPEKPKPKLKKPKEIVKSKKKIKRTNEPAKPRPKPTPQRPAPKPLTQKEIAERIKSNLPPPKNAVVGPPTDFSRFFILVREKCYGAWSKPPGLASQTSAMVKIRVARNGQVTSRTLVAPSGNPTMDASVMRAANAVTYITPLPSSYRESYKDVTLEFKIGE